MRPPVVAMLERMRQMSSWRAQVQWGERAHRWVSPSEATPVYANEQLHIFGRTRKELLGETWAQCLPAITLVDAAQGQEAIHLNLPARVCERPALAKLIAQREMMCSGAAEALDIALRHQLISEQTSMVIVHERDIGNKALGVPTQSSVDQMGSGNVALSVSFSSSGPHFSREDVVSYDQQALWRLPSKEEVAERLEAINPEDFEVPKFLQKYGDETPFERISRRVKRAMASIKGGESQEAAAQDESLRQPTEASAVYTTPLDILQDVNRLAARYPNSEETFKAYFASTELPPLVREAIDEILSSLNPNAIGVFFLVLNVEVGRNTLARATERWLEKGLESVEDHGSIASYAKKFNRLLSGVSSVEWPVHK
jgi:hypothetical protein